MLPTIDEYNYSKHYRRIQSKHKQSKKLWMKNKTIQQIKQIKYKSKRDIKCKKSLREIQHKQWNKSNKRIKSKHTYYNEIQQEIEIFNRQNIHETVSNDLAPLPILNKSSITKLMQQYRLQCYTHDVKDESNYCDVCGYFIDDPKYPINTNIRIFDLVHEKLPFEMNTFEGQCKYWYHIMDKIGIIKKLFSHQYLSQTVGYDAYNPLLERIISNLLNTKHILYILNKVDLMVTESLNKGVEKAIMSKQELLYILNEYDYENIGYNIHQIIVEYLLTNDPTDMLYHHENCNDSTEGRRKFIKAYRYNVNGYEIITNKKIKGVGAKESCRVFHHCSHRERSLGIMILDGKDVTDIYTECQKHAHAKISNAAHFDSTFFLFKMVWIQFSAYYKYQKKNNLEMDYSVFFTILFYCVDLDIVNRYQSHHARRRLKMSPSNIELWNTIYNTETENNPSLRSILIMLKRSLSPTHVDWRDHKLYSLIKEDNDRIFYNRWTDILYLKMKDISSFCVFMKDNTFTNNNLFVKNHHLNDDHHLKFKEFWLNLWKMVPANIDAVEIENMFDLTVFYSQKYRESIQYRGMGLFDNQSFIYDYIIPMMMKRNVNLQLINIHNICLKQMSRIKRNEFFTHIWKIPSTLDMIQFKKIYDLTVSHHCIDFKQYNHWGLRSFQYFEYFDANSFIRNHVMPIMMDKLDIFASWNDNTKNHTMDMLKKHKRLNCEKLDTVIQYIYRMRAIWDETKRRYNNFVMVLMDNIDIRNISDENIKGEILNVLNNDTANNVISHDEMIKAIDNMSDMLHRMKSSDSTPNMMNVKQYVTSKYIRRYRSEQIHSVREDSRRKYQKYNKKAMNQRIKHKIKKYGNRYLFSDFGV